ncbi:hypothetical protein JOQ06_024196 [Pogonophryne albipinna]|uniref:Cadherin domain-containing protein n=1 Tax=Pogonophryne albipinna TaxID=1090488 RepID=A0AAD6FSR0_9TELE|nr:hypothetical protein JOQ06_024196 [Pogonophryne albipinna]
MEQRRYEMRRARGGLFGCVVAVLLWSAASAQIRYSISEEVNEGTVVGNIAKDLGLDKSTLKDRKYRIVSSNADPLFHVNQNDGVLYVSRKIDREEVCAQSSTCLMNLKTVLENPLEVHYVGVEVLDINDNYPIFPQNEKVLDIFESVLPGTRFQLKPSRDPDSGHFSVQQYKLSPNDHLRLEVKDKGADGKIPILVIQKSLDRETSGSHSFVLTAMDGGKPPKSGTMNIVVNVLDVNDNAPVFSREGYSVMLNENAPVGTTVIQVNATDLDEGTNGDVVYSFTNSIDQKILNIFNINTLTGEITVKGLINYEEKDRYEIEIEASDKGLAPFTTDKSVIIKIVDINDNAPEIEVTSFSNSIPEDSRPGTTVALISVNDLDSGLNGKVICSIVEDAPFVLTPSLQDKMFSLVTKSPLDREKQSQYVLTITAKDAGQPPLSSEKTIHVVVSDVNDNSPEFSLSPYTFYITEANEPGTSVFSVKALDRDENDNAQITYHILRDGSEGNKLTSFLNINSETGDISALKSFDFETLKTFHFQVVATDSGTPSLSSNVTVHVFILDQNDNAPVILYPVSSNGSAEGVEEIPRNVNAGHLVTKVRAYDADIGYNGWLLFSLQEVTAHSLFGLDRYTGQIRTLRSFTETDEAAHKLLILVKDNGNVSLSATATVVVKLVEPREAFDAADVKSATKDDEDNNVTFYLMITLGSVSTLFLISIIVLIAMQCSKSTDYTSKYLQETNYDGTLCHSIQYRSGDKRYMLVGPRMSIGSTIVPGSHANTLVLPDRRGTSTEQYKLSPNNNFRLEVKDKGEDAFDRDENDNAQITYHILRDGSEGNKLTSYLNINSETGDILALKSFDFETLKTFQFQVVATDSGTPSLSSNVTVHVFILDQNDNAPVILYPVSSNGSAEGVEEIPRNVNAGHLVTKVRAYDADIGYNGWLLFSLQEVTAHSLFGLDRYTGQIRTLRSFTETDEAEHKLLILVKDNGNVSLSATATVVVKLVEPREAFAAADVKSATKDDEDNNVTFYLMITLGSVSTLFLISIIVLIAMQCSKSTDYTSKYLQETNYDGTLCHSIQYRSGDKRYMLVGPRMSIGSTIVPGSHANTLVLPDRRVTSTEFQVVATDSGTPSLSSNVTVHVFILDQNDNAPVILYPVSSNGSAEGVEEIPRNVNAGHLVTKVRAYDADIGYNGWLLFSLQEVTAHSLFGLDRYTGQIRTLRSFTETDEAEHKLFILVKDNGNVSLSATATVVVKLVEPREAFAAADVKSATKDDEDNNVTFYLMITLGSVSTLFLISIIVLIAMQCSKSTDYTSKYLQETNYDGTLCHSIQYRSGDKRYMLVGPRMSIGSTIVPGSHANTLVLPDRRGTSTEFQVVATDSGTPSLSSNVTVHVFILDQNDNAPVILYPVSSNGSAEGVEEIPRNVNAGHLVTKVRAYDADIGYNGWLLFSLQEVTAHSLFGLDRYTGQIRTLRSFTETDEAEHKLLILVKDNGNVSLSATATVVVKLVEPREAFAAADVKSATKDDEDNNVTFYLMITLGSVSTLFLISIIVLIAMQCSKSTDYTSKYLQETNYDGTLCHSIQYRSGDKRYMLVGPRMSIGSTIVPGSHANTLVLPDRRGTSTEFQVVATDSGTPSLSSNVTVHVFILDQNDNAPVILYPVSSNGSAEGVEEIPRNVNAGHLVTKVRAYDADIGYNGWLLFSLQEVTAHSLFGLDRYTGQIRTLRSFTETDEAEHKLLILVKDNGNVSLSATATVVVKLVEPREAFAAADVKSATKDDEDNNVTFYLMITLGSVSTLFLISIIVLIAMQCSKSTDYTSKYLQETNYDGTLCHSIQYRSGDKRYMLVGPRMSIGSTIVPGSHANTLVLPDRRGTSTEFQVVATDSGTPSLSSNVTVHVFILDQNDNAPVILYPVSSNGSAEGVEEIPRNVNAGHLVTKVRAYDADIGYNGWLLFSLQEVTAHSLFGLDRYTGQIRILRSFTETDEAEHKLLILVKDNGNVSLSATATVVVKLVEPREAFAAADVKSATKDDEDNNVTFYLMITLGSVSTLFLISIIVLIAMQCSKSTDYTSKYLQETNYDGTLCHSIQYRSGDKRYMLVGPRMSIGSTIVPGSHANTLVLPDRRGTSTEEVQDGTVVGNIAKDLGLDKSALTDRGYRIVTGSTEPLFEVNQNDGILYAKKRIDREEVCDRTSPCLINLKTVLENPLEIHYVAVEILDINDHSPVFPEKEKRLEIFESALPGARFQLQAARDPDVGQLSIQQYRLSLNEYFRLEVKDRGEDRKFQVVATDSGTPSLSSNVTVHVFILDQNDNAPVILYPVSSNGSAEGVEEIPRNVNAGHLVTKVRAYDADIGYNGWLLFSLQEVTAHSLFGLDRYTGQIRTLRSFTETDEAEHKLLILVKDNGNVSLSATATVVVKLVEPREAFAAADVKSATKDDEDNNVTFYLMITLGSVSTLFLISIIVLIAMQCSKSTDYTSKYLQETNYDGTLCHSIQYRSGDKRYMLVGPRMSIGSTIVPGSHANTLVLPDRRGTSTEFQVVATDSGTPSLSSNVTVHVFILDQNDNAPVILYPVSSNGSAEGVEEIPRNVNAGHLVTKVRAYDADIGYNGWLLFSLQEVTAHSLFGLDRYTGQIRTLRSFTETDEAEHKLLILVKDNGNVSLSATATVVVKLVEPREAFAAADVKSATKDDEDNNVTFYLMITLGSVSTLFLISIIVLIAMQCSKSTDYTSKYLQETNYDGTLCHSIQYRSGDKRYMLVGPRMSIGSTIVPGSHANTLVLPDRRGTSTENDGVLYVSRKIDREGVCERSNEEKTLEIFESVLPGARFPLQAARDPDGGPFTVQQYKLSHNGHFRLEVKDHAFDRDENDNALITYHILRDGSEGNKLTSYLNINSETGDILALKSFDFETLKTFQLQVVATDSGAPSLSSNVTVHVFILDQNDNAPVILYPVSSNGSAEGVEEIPRNVNAGHLVTKVRAYDADIGYNGWLLFSLQEVTAHSLFGLDRYTGQIRTLRSFTETDEAEHKLLILVKDNGNVSLSATATVVVKLVEPREAFAAADVKSATTDDEDNNVTFYLMLTLGSVSTLFLISIIVLIAMQCSKSTDYTSKYLQETNYDGTLCHSIQYRSGDKRYMLVGPRMSIGSTIVPGSHANTLVLPDRRGTSTEVR